MDKVISSSGVAFSHGQHQDIVQMLSHIDRSGKTIDDYKIWVKQKNEDNKIPSKVHKHISMNIHVCETCNIPMNTVAYEDGALFFQCKKCRGSFYKEISE